MPSSITHQLIAEEVLKRLPESLAEKIRRSPDEYFLGAQGPDVFFFYRIGCRSEFNLGRSMHRYKVLRTFTFFLDALSGERPPRLSEEAHEKVFCYVLGFISHYATDCMFHPYVYNYLAKTQSPKRVHQQMENDWDVYFLRELKGLSVEKFRLNINAEEIVEDGSVAKLYGCLARVLERQDIEKNKFDRGIKNFITYFNFFHGKCYKKQRHFGGFEKFFHMKPFLGALYPRENPLPEFLESDDFSELSENRGSSVDILFDRAVEESERLIALFLDCLDHGLPLPEEEFSNSLLTAQPC